MANLGQIVVEAWESEMADDERRRRDQVTQLHDWRRAHGRWVDRGYVRCPWRWV